MNEGTSTVFNQCALSNYAIQWTALLYSILMVCSYLRFIHTSHETFPLFSCTDCTVTSTLDPLYSVTCSVYFSLFIIIYFFSIQF